MSTPQLAKKSKDGSRPGYGGAWDFVTSNWQDLAKTGIAALSTFASHEDQKKKNEMQKQAYEDYMKQVNAAGEEARAAIDINYTPMTVSNRPTTKADVTDFTAVAAQGGLMSIPNKQRKRYARGPEEWEVETMDEEVLTPYDLQMEEGVNIGEQVFYDTGNPRQDAWGVWNSGGVNQEIYEFDFEIFFDSGDWMDYISQAPAATGDMQMASHEGNDAFLENRYQELLELGLSPAEAAAQAQKELSSGDVPGPMATGGIAGLRHGGRIGYNAGGDMAHRLSELIKKSNAGTITPKEENEMEQLEIMLDYGPGEKDGGRIGYSIGELVEDEENIAQSITLPDGGKEVVTDSMTEIEGQTADYKYKIQQIAEQLADDDGLDYWEDLSDSQRDVYYGKAFDMWKSRDFAKGGRVKRAPGGIMNLGGLEKDYRTTGGFVPIGGRERADDVPARLSKNEFVMTADAVRAAGGGSINKGAQRMYDTMKHLEASPGSKRMTA